VSYNTPRDYRGTVLKYGEGAAGSVAQTGEPLIIDDYRTWIRRATVYEKEQPFTAIVSAPMIWQGQVTGVIHVLDNVKNRRFTQTDLNLLILFANHAAIAVENTRLFEETQRQSKRLAKTLTSSELLHSDLGLAQVLEQITKGVVELGFQRAVLNVYQPEEKVVKVEAVAGLEGVDQEMLMGATYGWSDFRDLMQERFRISRSYLIRHDDIDWQRDFQGITAVSGREERGPGYWHPEDMLLVPLRGTQGEPVGLISVDEPVDALPPDLDTIQTLEAFANQAAIAIENARLYEAATELHKQTRRDAETRAMLLHEVNHRVKNNLAAIIGLLYVEKRHAQEENLTTHQTILTDMINRIQGLATVHNMLSDSEWSSLALSDLTTQVIHSALQFLPPDKDASVAVTPAPVRVRPAQANSLALVINELATNTVKYALPAITQRHPIRITVHVGYEDDLVLLEFRDNGPGYPEEVLRLEQHNVGMYLIQNIVSEQLQGELNFYNDQGAVATIRFKALEK
jgi:two-component sensor histidine kinase